MYLNYLHNVCILKVQFPYTINTYCYCVDICIIFCMERCPLLCVYLSSLCKMTNQTNRWSSELRLIYINYCAMNRLCVYGGYVSTSFVENFHCHFFPTALYPKLSFSRGLSCSHTIPENLFTLSQTKLETEVFFQRATASSKCNCGVSATKLQSLTHK